MSTSTAKPDRRFSGLGDQGMHDLLITSAFITFEQDGAELQRDDNSSNALGFQT